MDTLYTNVESVQPDAGDVGVALLGVSISVLLGKAPDSLPPWGTPALFRPWTWTPMPTTPAADMRWTVYGLTADGAWEPLSDVAVYPVPNNHQAGDPEDAAWETVVRGIKDGIRDAESRIAAGKEAPDTLPPTQIHLDGNSFTSRQESVSRAKKLTSMLLNLASAPYPIPEKLQLAVFLRVKVQKTYNSFVALPAFQILDPADHSKDQTYDPGQGPPPTGSSGLWVCSFDSLTMHSESSAPAFPGVVDQDLWLAAVPASGRNPLVNNWQAHVPEVLGPYLDMAHLLTTTADDPGFSADLAKVVAAQNDGFTKLRQSVLDGLYQLSAGGFGTTPPNWVSTLKGKFTDQSIQSLPVLNNGPASDFPTELANLRRLVTAFCANGVLQKQVPSVPASYSAAEMAPVLLTLQQSMLVAAKSSLVAPALRMDGANVPAMLAAVLNALLVVARGVLTEHLTAWGAGATDLVNACLPLPAANGDYTRSSFGLRKDLFLLALGTIHPGTRPALTGTSAPLVLPALQTRSLQGDGADPLRGFRGVGLLLQRSDQKKWSSPSIASPASDPSGETGTPNCSALVATRPVYDRDLLTGTLLYNNGPLACQNPLHLYLESDASIQHLDPITGDAADFRQMLQSPVRYAPYESGTRIPVGTPGLQAGATYNFATFVISNSGALPQALRDAYPARFKLPATVPQAHTSSVQYLRTVPVAGLEMCDSNGKALTDKGNPLFPAVPSGVLPRAAATSTSPAGAMVKLTDAAQHAHPALLFLARTPVPNAADAPATVPGVLHDLTFSVRLPSIDAVTWDRAFGWSLDKPVRYTILDAAFKAAAAAQGSSAPNPVRITDPAVSSVDFRLYRWLTTTANPNGAWSEESTPVSFLSSALADGMAALPEVATVPITITVSADDRTVSLRPGSGQAQIIQTAARTRSAPAAGNYPLQAGEVYLLEARLDLNLKSPTTLASPTAYEMMPLYAQPPSGASAGRFVVGYQMLIEIASPAMPADLLTQFSIAAQSNGNDQQLVLMQQKAATPTWNNIYRVDFLRQLWKWTGRTQPKIDNIDAQHQPLLESQPFPADKPLDSPVTRGWELVEFAGQPPDQHLESGSTLNHATGTYEGSLDLSLDPRATFIRAAPRMFSRYAGVYQNPVWAVQSTIDDPARPAWSRLFVKARARTLQLPRLKALLPLTESAFLTYGTPGTLAVFDGPAFEQAGLAERLQVGFTTVIDPRYPTDLTKTWKQVGPDALTSPSAGTGDASAQQSPALSIVGPIGHTADPLSGLTPKFLSHSYIIRPDTAKPNTPKDMSWWFAELEFWLETDPASTAFGNRVQSDTVRGSWIQFLPGYQRAFDANARLLDGLTFQYDTGKKTFTLFEEGNDSTASVIAPGNKSPHLSAFLLVERLLRDVAGSPRQQYFGIAAYKSDLKAFQMLGGQPNVPPASSLQVSMLYTREGLLKPEQFATDADFWIYVTGTMAEFSADANNADVLRMVPVNLSAPIQEKQQ